MENKYRIRESIYGKFKAEKLTISFFLGHAIGRPKWKVIRALKKQPSNNIYYEEWNSHAEAEECMIERMERDVKQAENNGNKWGVVRNKPKGVGMDTNYEKAMSLKREYEDLKKQLKSIKDRMVDVKQKAKDELNWIMSDEVEK